MLYYHPEYFANLGNHVFPMEKYSLVLEELKKKGHIKDEEIISPEYPQDEDILLVHTPEYYSRVKTLSLSYPEILRLELPLTREVVRAFHWHVGGTISALKNALRGGKGINVGGGFHHAFPDHGEGFCLFNDVAIAIRKGLKENWFSRVLIIDLDLHQGNGNAFIFREEKEVFTFSMHQEENYPLPKIPGDRDIGLPDGTGDEKYLAILEKELSLIFKTFSPEVVIYIAGVDPFKGDILGGLNLTREGMRRRDELVRDWVNRYQIPVVVTLGGGYARRLEDTVSLHAQTLEVFLFC